MFHHQLGSRKIYLGGWGALGAPFPTPAPPGRGLQQLALFLPCFSCRFHEKTTGTVTVTVTVSLQRGDGGHLLWSSAVLILPPPPPHKQVGAKIFRHLY